MNTQNLQPKSSGDVYISSLTRLWSMDREFKDVFDHPSKYLEVPESERNKRKTDVLAILFTNRLQKVNIEDLSTEENTCPVCWDVYGDREFECAQPLKTPCGHIFGRKCLIRAITHYRWKCSACRQDMIHLATAAAAEQRRRDEGYSKKLCRKLIWVGLFPVRILWRAIKPSLHRLTVESLGEDYDW